MHDALLFAFHFWHGFLTMQQQFSIGFRYPDNPGQSPTTLTPLSSKPLDTTFAVRHRAPSCLNKSHHKLFNHKCSFSCKISKYVDALIVVSGRHCPQTSALRRNRPPDHHGIGTFFTLCTVVIASNNRLSYPFTSWILGKLQDWRFIPGSTQSQSSREKCEYFLQKDNRSLMFFLLSLGFTAGRHDLNHLNNVDK